MSAIQLNFFSRCLNFRTEVKAVLPEYIGQRDASVSRKKAFDAARKFPVVYLLHGYTGDYSDWMSMIPVERYAEKYGFAIVMPHGYNSWYMNIPHGPQVETYIAEELPAAMEALLPVSEKASERFIAGLSMGGTGAVHTALVYPDQYRAAASASGVFSKDAFHKQYRNGTPEELEAIDRMDFAWQGRPDILELYRIRLSSGEHIPEHLCLYGTEDDMLPFQYRQLGDIVRKYNAPVQMRCRSGGHDFKFWDSAIQEMLQWFSSFGESF